MAGEESLDASPKKTGDRKRKGASDAPRKVMAFRVAADTYDKLQVSSQERGLSLTEEIERRIAFSFDMADTPRNEFILRAMAQALRYTEAVMDIPWNKSPAAALVCRDALVNASDLVVRSYAYDLHPSDISDVSSDETGEQAFEKRKAKIAEGVGLAGESIGLQVVQAFLGKPIDEIRTIGADHILAAKAFAEQWKRETFGWAGNSLGDLPRPPASPDEEEDAAEASEPQAAPAPRKGSKAKAGT